MSARDDAVEAARRAFIEHVGHRLTVDEQIAFAIALDVARAGGALLYRDDMDALRAACRRLLDAEQAYRLAPTLENASRLTRARRAVEDAVGPVNVDRPTS